jgi:hypothetical protein
LIISVLQFWNLRKETASLHLRRIEDRSACAQREWQGDATGQTEYML